MKQESLGKTLLIAFSIVLVCSLLVSAAVTMLRPIQTAQKAPQNFRYILQVAGLIEKGVTVDNEENIVELFQHVETSILDLNTADYVSINTVHKFDYRQSLTDPSSTIVISKKEDLAHIERKPKQMPIYWIYSSTSKAKIVLPIFGKGMWSMIHGYIALEQDFNTIAGVYFYEQADTPGIGEQIQQNAWLTSWQGKRLYDDKGSLALLVNRSETSGNSIHQIDGITGATKTVNGVINLIHFWFGKQGYQAFLAKQRESLGD